MTTETLRWAASILTCITAAALIAFTHDAWRRLQPPAVKAILICVNVVMLAIVYGLAEAAHQHAPFGARIFLIVVPVTALLIVLVVALVRDTRRR